MNGVKNPVSMSDQINSLRVHGNNSTMTAPILPDEERICPGCKRLVVNENGGVVVAFGQSYFHVDCFKCAKCHDQVTADTNLLLLSDGSPVCANCSYSCNVCGQPILDEAIMTGDDSYHAHCFNCRMCKKRIDELMFAKTSQGIYCMDCHNERVARSRRHQERKERERKEKERKAAIGEGVNGIESVAAKSGDAIRSHTAPEQYPTPQNSASFKPSTPHSAEFGSQAQGPPARPSPMRRGYSANDRPPSLVLPFHKGAQPSSNLSSAATSPVTTSNGSMNAGASVANKQYSSLMLGRPASPTTTTRPTSPNGSVTVRADTLAVTSEAANTLQKRKSFNDRPLNVLLKETHNTELNGLLIPENTSSGSTSRKDKRRSINPAIALSFNGQQNGERHGSISPGSTPSTPNQPHMQGTSPPRETFSAGVTLSPPSMVDTSTVQSPPALRLDAIDSPKPMGPRPRSTSSHTNRTLDRVPARTSSRTDHHHTPDHNPPVPPLPSHAQRTDTAPPSYFNDSGHHTPQHASLVANGRVSPSLNVPDGSVPGGGILRHHRSLDDRQRFRTSTSSLGQTIELPARSGSSSGPTSPAHKVDVPRGVESGTDTEAESEEAWVQERDKQRYAAPERDSLPPLPPPKDVKGAKAGTRPPELKLDTSYMDIDDDDDDDVNGRDMLDTAGDKSDLSHESLEQDSEGQVTRTSHSTFIAPALPPIRFSLDGAALGLGDILKAVPKDGKGSKLGGIREDKENDGLKVDVTLVPPPSKSLGTPTSATTVLGPGSIGEVIDSTPVKRREPLPLDIERTVRRDQFGNGPISRSHSPSPSPRPLTEFRGGNMDNYPDVGGLGNRSRSYSDSRDALPLPNRPMQSREAMESTSSLNSQGPAQITVTGPDNVTKAVRSDTAEVVKKRLQEAVNDATERGSPHVKLDLEFISAITVLLQQRGEEFSDMKRKLDGMKRASQQYMDGLTVAQTEYDKELKARRDAEAEVSRLRVLLSGQAVRLSAISGDTKRQEAQKQLSRELSDSLSSLERDLSKLRLERDLALAEVEELSSSKSSIEIVSEPGSARLSRSLSIRFDNIKNQYQHELLPLTTQREALMREITELRASRDAFLEETTMLSSRNEELAQLNAQYLRRIEVAAALTSPDRASLHEQEKSRESSFDKPRAHVIALSTSGASSTAASAEETDSKFKIAKPETVETHAIAQTLRPKFMKWPGLKNQPQVPKETPAPSKAQSHVFQQISMLRVARCDHCGDKMWGSQLRCINCSLAVHTRCMHSVHLSCSLQETPAPTVPGGPSLFGRDLAEQVRADSKMEDRTIPVIVEKCIDAVDALALDYEGIYRKTGGSGQSKAITQLFERGDYTSFDLKDTDRFNDICSVTSVLKSYFRALPDPLLTFALHDRFIQATNIKDPAIRTDVIAELVSELPKEHYYTTRALMLHLHRVRERSDRNLMHARNLGVVFGPTLMRSRDPNAEFSDMAGKALSVEWLIENAPTIFNNSPSEPH